MINTGKLAGQTLFITGASRGIGKAIALKAAQDGANIVIAAKTATPHPKLPGTIFTAAEEVEKLGGKSLACVMDIREEVQVRKAVEDAVKKFGGIDIVINNASAISLTGTPETTMKKFDLMQSVNVRGTFLVSKECLPHLKKSRNSHIINIAPPINLSPQWVKRNLAYKLSKYGMSMCVLGMHEEFRPFGIAVNALWPRTAIHTAATDMLVGPEFKSQCRKPEICADAAYAILIKNPKTVTGNFFIDDDVLKSEGITDFVQYACDPSNATNLVLDLYANPPSTEAPSGGVGQVFRNIEANLSPGVVKLINAVFAIVIRDDEAGNWYIDLKSGNGSCGQGEPPTAPDATLTMDSKVFFNIFSGKQKPAIAYMRGEIDVKGDLQSTMKLEIISSLESKL